MHVKIKNTINEIRKTVVFGNYDPAMDQYNDMKYPFLDLRSDEGVHVTIDDLEYPDRKKVLLDIAKFPLMITSIGMSSSINNDIYVGVLRTDVNGQKHYKDIQLISGKDKRSYEELQGIDGQTSLLFVLDPKEEINLELDVEPIHIDA